MSKTRKGAKILSKYAASRSKQSRTLPIASRSADVSGWLSFKSPQSILSAFCHGSILSFGSILSIGSATSILSIGSIGSILSIGSAGSVLSIGSAGSILSVGGAGAAPGRGPGEPETEILVEEEIPPEGEILVEEAPTPGAPPPAPPMP